MRLWLLMAMWRCIGWASAASFALWAFTVSVDGVTLVGAACMTLNAVTWAAARFSSGFYQGILDHAKGDPIEYA